ncbi:hypothetical protein BVC93_15885 [Mycobacterium sp. MS1601]|uniref:hypothetical protein n=1 Tax=Mycobacterium sp. MS1601 TaxID=1936029 RepID=UPI000979415F|nr:hypothetical protein [Mycobacterium sp. MS1601]AQA03651.1 hypothetical protein BVC93_15885 [Mycobacterium sp. MS1601]
MSLAVAVIAMLAAAGAWLRPLPDVGVQQSASAPEYTSQEQQEATEAICDTYRKTSKALTTAGGRTSDDPNAKFIIAVNTRLTLLANSSFLRQTLTEYPALPADKARIFREMASAYEDILLGQLADAPTESFQEANGNLDAADAEAAEVCE